LPLPAELHCVHFSAVTASQRSQKIIDEAERLRRLGRTTVLFVDEIHHFNKAQQNSFLPHVEQGTVILIGATTEESFFPDNRAPLSAARFCCSIPSQLKKSVRSSTGLRDTEGIRRFRLQISADAREFLVANSQGVLG
jgi:putative ATPase